MAQESEKKTRKKTDSVGRGLYRLYVLFLIGSVFLVGRLIYIQLFYQPDPKIVQALTPTSVKKTIEPARGAILSDDGRLLAMSLPIYDINMDCTVMKESYAKTRATDPAKGDSLEAAWMKKARGLADGLANILKEKSADEYYNLIKKGREQNRKYVRIAAGVERRDYNRLLQLPLFNEDRFHGGLIVGKENIRKYPYGKLARRTIGFVRNNKSNVENTHVGIEGKFDYVLHGKDGVEYLREIDNKERVHDSDSSFVRAEDGLDVRTTLNVDFQDIADKALREQMGEQIEVEGGCLVLMETATGAIKAMVNLTRDSLTTRLEETQNFAIGRRYEPGSVFKTVTLLSVLSDGYVKTLDQTLPTNHGVIAKSGLKPDVHISDYERIHGTREISVLDGFKISSNYVFAKLAIDNYGRRPQKFIDNCYLYKLGEAFDFDIDGLRTPSIPSTKSPGWAMSVLGNMGFGYATMETPLHILNFYNAIANKGKMMKPYLVESIEKYGTVVEKRGPAILNGSICTKAVADTITRALAAVTEEGTARRLKNAKCTVAGKTGTSFATIGSPTDPYKDKYGRKVYQASFVGFFPAESPKYSIICMIFTRPTHTSFQGGGIPALAVKTVVDELYVLDPQWGEVLHKTGTIPVMRDTTNKTKPGKNETGKNTK